MIEPLLAFILILVCGIVAYYCILIGIDLAEDVKDPEVQT